MINKSITILLLFFTFFIQTIYASHSVNKPDSYYMQKLVALAKTGDNSPFTAMVVSNSTGKILCYGVNHQQDGAIWHGEMAAIANCEKKYPNLNWKDTTLYTTGEPCPMCMSAIVWTGITRTVYGTSIPTLSKDGIDQISIRASKVISKSKFYHGELVGGVLQNETDQLFTNSKH